MTAIVETKIPDLTISWPLLPEDFILPDEPVENSDQPLIASALRQPLMSFPQLYAEALIVSNFALCAGIGERVICKAPDWMYVRPVKTWQSTQVRRSYTPHTEGTIPQVVMEFLSATYGEEYSVESTESVGKWYFYEQVIKVPCYVIFRPNTGRIEVYGLASGRYSILSPNESGRYWIEGLDLFVGVWEGTHSGRTGHWLRWWNGEGNLLLWPEEIAQQERLRADEAEALLEQEKARSQALLAKLREMGIEL